MCVSYTYLEKEGIFQDSWYVEVIAISTHTDHKSIVRHLVMVGGVKTAGTVDHTSLSVEIAGIGEVEMMLVPEPRVPAVV